MLHPWGRGYNLKKEKKEEVINELKGDFDSAKAIIFTDYKGMTVAELSDLRKALRDNNLKYKVVKNTLAKIAISQTPLSVIKDSFKGPVGIAISYDDPIIALKKVLEYSKKNDKLKINEGFIEGTHCTTNDLNAYAKIPPKNVLFAMFANGLKSPLHKLSFALRAILYKFIYGMEALKKDKIQK